MTFAVDRVLSIKHLPIGDKKSKWTGCGKAASAARAAQPHLAAAYSVLMVASRDIAGNCKNLVTHCFMKDV